MSPHLRPAADVRATALERRLSDIGWGLLFMLTGAVWVVPADRVPAGTWLFGVAAILFGLNIVRALRHIALSGFALVLGSVAVLAAIGAQWHVDLPLLAICFIIIGVSLVVKPLMSHAV